MSQAKRKADNIKVIVPQLVSRAISLSDQFIATSLTSAIAVHVFHTAAKKITITIIITIHTERFRVILHISLK